MITENLDDQDLPNLRQTCKKLCRSTHTTFIKRHFKERNHVVSPKSINALTELTADPEFGPHVKSIILNSADDFGLTNEPEESLYFNQLHDGDDMEIIFKNLVKHGNEGIIIGVSDNYPKYDQSSCISDELWLKSEKTSYGWSDLMLNVKPYDPTEVEETCGFHILLRHMADKAKKAGCRIKGIEIRMVGTELDEGVWEQFPFDIRAYHKLFQCDFKLVFGASLLKQTQQPLSTISYNQLTKIWKFENVSLNDLDPDHSDAVAEFVLHIIGNEAKMQLPPCESAAEIMNGRLRELLHVDVSGSTVHKLSTQELTQYLKLKMGIDAVSQAEHEYQQAMSHIWLY